MCKRALTDVLTSSVLLSEGPSVGNSQPLPLPVYTSEVDMFKYVAIF